MKSMQILAMALLILAIVAVAPADASGEVIYTGVNKTLSGNGTVGLDLDQNGIRDFTLVAASHVTSCGLRGGLIGSVKISPPVGNAVVATHLNFAALLPSGTRIKFQQPPYIVDQFVCPSSHHVEGFLGLEFQINGQTHFGWAQISVDASSTSTHTTLTGFAYETIPGQAINTGQISGISTP